VNVGDEIQVKVLKFDKDKQRVSLGFKQLTPDPWLDATERYPVGAHVHGRVLSVTDYGAFVELEQGIEGLVHLSEMTWSKRLKHPSKLVKPADEVETVVLSVNPADRRISLGMKQLLENPGESDGEVSGWDHRRGRVRNLTDFGAFIEIEDGIDGLVHVSNLSWTKRVKHPSEIVKKGEKVKAVVLGVEPQNRRLSLGIKQLQPTSGRASSPRIASATRFMARCSGRRSSARLSRSRRRGGIVPHLRGRRRGRRTFQAGNRPGARVQDHQDQRGREEGGPQPALRFAPRG